MVKKSAATKKTSKVARKDVVKDFHPMRMTVVVSAAAVTSLFLLCVMVLTF